MSTGVNGVRSSWLRAARNWSFARLARSSLAPSPLLADQQGVAIVLGELPSGDVPHHLDEAPQPARVVPHGGQHAGGPEP